MLTVGDIADRLDLLAPPASACEWDNPGLLVGRRDKEVFRVCVALDATMDVISEAIESGCDMIVTHHPIIFKGIKCINDSSALGIKLMDLIHNDVAVYSMHTNYDSCPGGMGDIVCETLGLEKSKIMDPTGYIPVGNENGTPDGLSISAPELVTDNSGNTVEIKEYGIGFVAKLPNVMTCAELAQLVKDKFDLPFVSFYDAGAPIKTIACCPGSGRSELKEVLSLHVDAFISGDMGHHEGIDLNEEGVSLIDAGHYGLEHIFVEHIGNFLRDSFPEADIVKDYYRFPAKAL